MKLVALPHIHFHSVVSSSRAPFAALLSFPSRHDPLFDMPPCLLPWPLSDETRKPRGVAGDTIEASDVHNLLAAIWKLESLDKLQVPADRSTKSQPAVLSPLHSPTHQSWRVARILDAVSALLVSKASCKSGWMEGFMRSRITIVKEFESRDGHSFSRCSGRSSSSR